MYLLLCKVADTLFHIQGDDLFWPGSEILAKITPDHETIRHKI